MSDAILGQFDLTYPVILGNPNLAEAHAIMRNGKATGEPKFSANLVFGPDHPDLPGLKAMAREVARANSKLSGIDPKMLRWPFKEGTKQLEDQAAKRQAAGKKPYDNEWMRGKVILVARSRFRPALAAVVNGKALDIDTSDTAAMKRLIDQHLYFGAEVLAQIKFNAYEPIEEGDRAGVNAYLQQVFGTGKGKRLSAARSAAATFRGYVGHPSTEDPTGGMDDDEIPF